MNDFENKQVNLYLKNESMLDWINEWMQVT